MQRVVRGIDPEFNICTSYHSDFFLLRTKVLVNEENAKIRSKKGSYEDPTMSFCHGGSTISIRLLSVENTISRILHEYGIYHVGMFYYEQSPLFHVVFSSESCVMKFLQEIQTVKNAMQIELCWEFFRFVRATHGLQTASQSFTVKVQPQLFLVSPNRQERKGAELHLVTTENCSLFVTRWKKSKLFDFGSLYQEEGLSSSTTITTSVPTPTKQSSISTQESPLVAFRKPTSATPSQITSQPTTLEEINTGKPVTFSIQATGTEPMNYQWQCRKQMQMQAEIDTDNLGNVKVENQEIQTEVVEIVGQYVQAEDTTQGGLEVENQEVQTEVVETVEQSVQAEDTTQEQEEQVQVLEKELQECHDEREEDTRHIESLEAEIEELRRRPHYIHHGDMETTGHLEGMDVIAETSVLITNQAQSFRWVGYGLKLRIPQQCLPAGLEECRLFLKVGLSGQFALPQNTSLVSAVYWLDSEPRQEFSKHLTLEIQHCVKPTHTSKLSFVQAECSQTHLPYEFKDVEGGVFSNDSIYGCVQSDHFSLWTTVCDTLLPGVQLYCARLYYLRKGVNQIDIYFVITKDLETNATVVKQEYTAKGATSEEEMRVDFESNSISLQEVNLQNGWRIFPVSHPAITKEEVDIFKPGQHIPSCKLKAVWTRQSKPLRLIHKVTLNGAKPPFNYINIDLDCDSIPLGGEITARDAPGQGQHRMLPDGLDSEPKLLDLMNEVAAEIPNKWRDIGLQLGLSHEVLEVIATISPVNTNLCYSNVFTLWENHNTHPYTWSKIVEVLKAPAVGEEKLATKIKSKLTGLPP